MQSFQVIDLTKKRVFNFILCIYKEVFNLSRLSSSRLAFHRLVSPFIISSRLSSSRIAFPPSLFFSPSYLCWGFSWSLLQSHHLSLSLSLLVSVSPYLHLSLSPSLPFSSSHPFHLPLVFVSIFLCHFLCSSFLPRLFTMPPKRV